MSQPSDKPRVVVRPPSDEAARRARVRGLVLALVVSDVLVVAILLVGLSIGWPWWAVAAAALLPLVVGVLAARTAYVLRRSDNPAGGGPDKAPDAG